MGKTVRLGGASSIPEALLTLSPALDPSTGQQALLLFKLVLDIKMKLESIAPSLIAALLLLLLAGPVAKKQLAPPWIYVMSNCTPH